MIGATLSFCHFFLNLTKLQLFHNGIILVGLRRKVTWQQGHLSMNQSQRERVACHVTAKLDFGVCAARNLKVHVLWCRMQIKENWNLRLQMFGHYAKGQIFDLMMVGDKKLRALYTNAASVSKTASLWEEDVLQYKMLFFCFGIRL